LVESQIGIEKVKEMKTRIVLWGVKGENEKVLLGIELKSVENKVLVHVVPEKEATEVFYNLIMNEWREGRDVEWPAGVEVLDRPLTASDPILPDHIKVQRTDVLQRAQSEWHFVVLSAKLKDVYESEIGDFKEKIKELTGYDGGVWEELKGFWGKVQGQIRDRNLFRNHANKIKSEVNELFEDMKKLRSSLDEDLREKSEKAYAEIAGALDTIEEKIEKGLGLQPLFNDLKSLQKQFKESDLVRKHQNKLWKRIDGAFKKVKAKRFGEQGESGGRLGRLQNRYEGLVKAINRMKSSIGKDKKDIQFEEKRINTTDGQLEAQLRTAKLKMIHERISSKQIKLDDMISTEEKLRAQIEREKARAEKEEKLAKAREEAKSKIAEEVKASKEKMEEENEKLQKAAEKIKVARKPKPKPVATPKSETPAEKSEESHLDKVVSDMDAVLEEE